MPANGLNARAGIGDALKPKGSRRKRDALHS
jgi:hypothetical protein